MHIRTAGLKVKEFSHTFPDATDSALLLAERGYELFLKNYTFGEPLRSLGLRAISLKEKTDAGQLDMFGESDDKEKKEKVEDSLYDLRERFGKSGIKRAITIEQK